MTTKIKEFIRDNIQLVDDNKWDELYDKASKDHTLFRAMPDLSEMTQLFIDSGCTFDTMTYVCEGFMFGSPSTSFTIPKSVTAIDYGAFALSELTEITIPAECHHISSFAFGDCVELEKVKILSSSIIINSRAFSGCDNLRSIEFNGTRDQWLNNVEDFLTNCVVTCSDGTIRFDKMGYIAA